MRKLRELLSDTVSVKRRAEIRVRRYRLAVPMAVVALMAGVTARAQDSAPFSFDLVPVSTAITNCLPDATAKVLVFPREDVRGVDTLDLKAQGLPPNTGFAVFLTELPGPPFGAVEYIGDFTTNAAGKGSLRVDAVIDEAFALGSDRVHRDLNHVVIWFADQTADDFCIGSGGNPGPFDGDGQSGTAVLSSKSSLPNAPLP